MSCEYRDNEHVRQVAGGVHCGSYVGYPLGLAIDKELEGGGGW